MQTRIWLRSNLINNWVTEIQQIFLTRFSLLPLNAICGHYKYSWACGPAWKLILISSSASLPTELQWRERERILFPPLLLLLTFYLTHKHIPKYQWSTIKLPVGSQRDKARQRGESAKEDEGRLRRKRSKIQKVKVCPTFQLVSRCHVSDAGSDWNQ